MVKLSALQMCSKPDVDANLQTIRQHCNTILQDREITAHLLVLPECCLFFGGQDQQQLNIAKQHRYLVESLSQIAREYHLYLLAGTIPIPAEKANKFYNASLLFAPNGEQISRYNKIHLFDVEVADSARNYFESRYTQAGDQVINAQLDFANIGQTVCYDLRFPELFRQLTTNGADIICVPSAFTQVTGQVHWLPLLQARAIENQTYIIAAAQQGIHENGRETYGHSMIIDPWGKVLAELAEGEGIITAEYDLAILNQVRKSIPVAKHNQFQVSLTATNGNRE